MEREQIRKYGLEIGVDAVGFVALEDYKSPKSPDPKSYLSKARSIIVLAHRMIDGALDSKNPRFNIAGRMAVMDTSKSHLYLMARLIEGRTGKKASPVLSSTPRHGGPDAGPCRRHLFETRRRGVGPRCLRPAQPRDPSSLRVPAELHGAPHGVASRLG